MKKVKRKLIFLIGIIGMISMLMGLTSYTYSYKDVYLWDELKVGDFIPNGATIITNVDYHDGSKRYVDEVHIGYYGDLDDTDNYEYGYRGLRYDSIKANSTYVVRDYQNVFNTVKFEFNGWIVSDVNNNYVYLEPYNDGADIITYPSLENDYKIEAKCLDGDDVTNIKWYKYADLDNILVTGNRWNYKDGILSLRDFKNLNNGTQVSIKINFNAKKNDILYFERKSYFKEVYSQSKRDVLKMILDDEEIILDEADYYEKEYYDIKKDGEHTLEFNFTKYDSDYAYMYIKNLRILSYLGSSLNLNIEELSNNDKIYYEVWCNDYVMDGTTNILKDEVIEDKLDDVNPPTQDIVYKYFTVMGGSLVLIIILNRFIKYRRP